MSKCARSHPPHGPTLDPKPERPSHRLRTLVYVGERLSLSYWAARDLVLRGHLPCVRLPGKRGKTLRRILVDDADLENFISAHRETRAVAEPVRARRAG